MYAFANDQRDHNTEFANDQRDHNTGFANDQRDHNTGFASNCLLKVPTIIPHHIAQNCFLHQL